MFRIIPAFMAVSVLRCVRLERNIFGSAALSKSIETDFFKKTFCVETNIAKLGVR